MFGKSQSHPLCHFDVPAGTIFQTGVFVLVECLGPKGGDATLGTTLDQTVVHAVNFVNLWDICVLIYQLFSRSITIHKSRKGWQNKLLGAILSDAEQVHTSSFLLTSDYPSIASVRGIA